MHFYEVSTNMISTMHLNILSTCSDYVPSTCISGVKLFLIL